MPEPLTGCSLTRSPHRFDLLSVDDLSFIAVVMTEGSRVKSRLLRTEMPVDADSLAALAALLNAHFTHLSVDKMNQRLMSLSSQTPPALFMTLNLVVEYAAEVLEGSEQQRAVTAGANNILKLPEFRDADKAHELMTFFVDNKENLPVPEDDAPLKILIGPENVSEALQDTSVVVASYDIGDGMRGLVGVVGPTRMDYATVAARLSYFADSLTRMFGRSELPPSEEHKE